jgi:hypothetical protein
VEYKQHFLNTVSCAVLGRGIRMGVGFYRWVKILIGIFLRGNWWELELRTGAGVRMGYLM